MGTTIPTLGQTLMYFGLVTAFGTLLYYQIWAHCENQTVKANYYPLNSLAGFNLLSPGEKVAYELLSQVPPETIWGIAIQRVLSENSVASFRLLICELKSQADDEPDVMKNIIGKEAYQAIVHL